MTMREILFRGKNVRDGDWIFGWYSKACYGSWPLRDAIADTDKAEAGCLGFEEVDPKTVGQFTGMTDKNGKKIFEGDIVKYVDDGYVATGVARFGLYASADATFAGHEGFYLDWAGYDWLRKDIGFWATMRPIEIIGNIHDNPELMEDK